MAKKTEDTGTEAATQTNAPLLTVQELADKHGQARTPAVSEDSGFSREHLGADCAHGWQRHKYWTGQDVCLSDADYMASLAAFKAGKTHAPSNMRPLTVISPEQKSAHRASLKSSAPTAKNFFGAAQQMAMTKARSLAQSSGVKLKGAK